VLLLLKNQKKPDKTIISFPYSFIELFPVTLFLPETYSEVLQSPSQGLLHGPHQDRLSLQPRTPPAFPQLGGNRRRGGDANREGSALERDRRAVQGIDVDVEAVSSAGGGAAVGIAGHARRRAQDAEERAGSEEAGAADDLAAAGGAGVRAAGASVNHGGRGRGDRGGEDGEDGRELHLV